MNTFQHIHSQKEFAAVKSTLTSEFDIDEVFEERPGIGYFIWKYDDSLKAVYYSILAYIYYTISVAEKSADGKGVTENLVYNPDMDDRIIDTIADSIHKARYKKVKDGFIITLALKTSTFSDGRATYYLAPAQREEAYKNLATVIAKSLGPNFFDLTKTVNLVLKPEDVLRKFPSFDPSKNVTYEKPEAWNNLKKVVRGFRLVSPVQELTSSFQNPGSEDEVLRVSEAQDKVGFMRSVLRSREFVAYVDLFVTKTEAEYVTQTPFADIRPVFLAQWLSNLAYGDWKGDFSSVERIRPISSIVKANAAQQSIAKPRTSKEGLMMSDDGSIIFVPTVEASAEYEDYLQSMGENEHGDFCFDSEYVYDPEKNAIAIKKQPKFPANRVIYTDWVNNKLAYTDTNGALKIYDLQPCIPVRTHSMLDALSAKICSRAPGDPVRGYLSSITKRLGDLGIKLSDFLQDGDTDGWEDYGTFFWERMKERLDNNETLEYMSTVQDFVLEVWRRRGQSVFMTKDGIPVEEKFTYFEEHSTPNNWTVELLSETSPIPMLRPIGRMLKAAFNSVGKNLMKEFQRRSVINAMGEFAFLIICSLYMGRRQELQTQDFAERQLYLQPKTDPKWEPGKNHFPLTKGLKLQPHQVKVADNLRHKPEFAVVDVQPGGGKTISVITDILMQLKESEGRILVMCPSHLVKDYVKEANKVTGGRLNVIAVTSSTLANHGYDTLETLVRKAPKNSFIITDYNFIKGNARAVAYGTEDLNLSENAEFLRQFDFSVVYMDESHYLKNESQRTFAAQRLISEIPMKRLVTGTFVADTILDVVKQFALLDPSIFGSREQFVEKYAEQSSGGKVTAWKPGTEQMVASRMRQFATVCTIKKKEWAALLPPREEQFHFVKMTENQRLLYDSILHETMEMIRQKLGKKLGTLDGAGEDLSEEAENKIALLLRPYMQRLEQFISCPKFDKAGEKFFKTPEDKVSPKTLMAIKIIKQHIDSKIPGKILIFTQYKNTAKDVFDSLPPALKARAIHYTAGQKFKCAEEFENNPDKVIMVGVEASMNTGLNFQMASRLIRMETVWTPGNLTQGEARIDRPLFPKDFRKGVYFDWICVNYTVDVTKIGRLITKAISNSKLDNPNDTRYQSLPQIEIPSMSLNNIMLRNDYKSTMSEHFESWQNMSQYEQADFDSFRNDPKNRKDMVVVPDGDPLPDSKLMKFIPYVAGMDLYSADKLGLVRYPVYVRDNADAPEMEVDPETGEEILGDVDFDPRGLIVHTEMGEGECVGESNTKLTVRFSDGEKQSFDKLSCFVATNTMTSTKSIREQLAKLAGLATATPIELHPDFGVEEPDEEVVKDVKKTKKPLVEDTPIKKKPKQPAPNTDEVENKVFQLFFTVINNTLTVAADTDDPDVAAADLKSYGFKAYPAFMFAFIRNAKTMEAVMEQMKKKFAIQPKYLKTLEELQAAFNLGKSKLLNVDQASKVELQDFFRTKKKPAAANEIRPYPIIQDDELYLCIDLQNTPAAKQLKTKIKVPGVEWEMEDSMVLYFAASKPDAKSVLENIIGDGHKISNLKTLKAEFNEIKLLKK